MESLILLVIIIIVIAIVVKLSANIKPSGNQSTAYSYVSRNSIMTQRESKFFRRLSEAFQTEYFIFPQVHLPALLDYRGNDQKKKWSAFLHINRKSVDYILCDKNTLQPICAIELDDWTHTRKSRIERDEEVERILSEARMPLIRIKDPEELDVERLIQGVANAKAIREVGYSS